MNLRVHPIALLLVLLLPVLGGCEDEKQTIVFIKVEGRLAMRDFTTLDIVVSNAGSTATRKYELEPGQRLPLVFSISPTGRTGTLTVEATAKLADGLDAGRGRVEVEIVTDDSVERELLLEPDDFVVNEAIVDGQFVVFDEELAGRQLAVGPGGAFVAAFENTCPLDRCDVLGRYFDRAARPARNGTSADDGDFIINQAPEYAETPVIAGGENGYLVAWASGSGVPGTETNLKATVLDRDAAHVQPFDISITQSPEFDVKPTAIALAGGGYVVLWERGDGATRQIFARLFSSSGSPVVNAITDTDSEFLVTPVETRNQVQSHGVGLPGGGFVIVWSQPSGANSNVFGRVFAANAQPRADLQITTYPAAQVSSPRAAATADGFVVGWQAGSATIPSLTQRPLLVRRYTEAGEAISTETQVVERTFSFRATPALAVRAADGAIGVAWPECGDGGDLERSCGIRFRLLRPTGLPVGDPFFVNTTLKADQRAPSIAAVDGGGFALLWTDLSNAPPDNFDSSVRARVIYPDLARRDGTIGALCGGAGDATCSDGLTCQPGDVGNLCHPSCTDACPSGGLCLNGTYCAFQ